MAIGLGQQPVGIGPFGAGIPLPDAPVVTPVPPSSRKLVGGQYVFSDGSNPDGDTDAHQLVYLASNTLLGSSCVETLGRGPEPSKIAPNFVQQKRAQLEAAYADLIKRRVVTLDSIEVQTEASRSQTVAHLTDLTTNEPLQITMP